MHERDPPLLDGGGKLSRVALAQLGLGAHNVEDLEHVVARARQRPDLGRGQAERGGDAHEVAQRRAVHERRQHERAHPRVHVHREKERARGGEG